MTTIGLEQASKPRRSGLGLATAILAGFALLASGSPVGADDPLDVLAEVDPRPVYPGQAAEVRIKVPGAGADLEVSAPRSEVAEIQPRGPIAADPGSDPVRAIRRFVVIPKRSGELVIPSFRARSGGRSASSRPLKLTVLGLPNGGRSANFLGGVGSFEVRGEVGPAKIRLGQSLEYRLQILGEAAWGSARGPDLASIAEKIHARIEPVPGSGLETGSPSRTFRYRVRPTRAGKATLPPIAVVALDPNSRRYATKATASLPIEVEEPARFDPGAFRYEEGLAASPGDGRPRRWAALGASALILIAGVGLGWRRAIRSRARRLAGARAWATTLSGRLDPAGGVDDLARQITSGFAELLRRGLRRPPGVLTPPEADLGLAGLTSDRAVGDRAGRLIAACDRAIYGGVGPDPAGMVAEARAILGAIGESPRGGRPVERGAEGGSRNRVG